MKLEGEVGEIVLTSRLVELWRERFTGAIRFENDGIIKIIYFKGGDVLSASTNDRADSIDEILLRAGKVTRDHVKQALAKRKESETLGDALLNLGFITRKELAWARRVQVIGVIRSIEGWSRGSYTIVADYLPKREEGTLFPLPQLIVEMIVTEGERSRFEQALDGGSVRFTKTANFDEEFARLGLNDEANRIAGAIDGQRSASDVAVASGQDGFNTFKLLHALAVLGLVERVGGGVDLGAAPVNEFDAMDTPAESWDFSEPVNIDDSDSLGLPSFDAEADPGIDVPLTTPVVTPVVPPSSAPANPNDYWSMDDEPEAPLSSPVSTEDDFSESSSMPVWEAPAAAVPAAAAFAPTAKNDVQWGFDEAQIETARRASVPVSHAEPIADEDDRPSKRRRVGVLAAVLVALLALGAAGYYGFVWWQEQQNAEVEAAAARPAPVRPRPATPPTATTETLPVPAVADTATAPVTTTAPVPAPVAPAPAVVQPPVHVTAPPSQVALNPVTPARPAENTGDARARYDALARQNAQNVTGNFAVQLVIVCEVSNLEKAIRQGGDKLWYVPITVKGRSCYRVFWGRYDTREAATRAIGEVPAPLRESRPVAVSIPKG